MYAAVAAVEEDGDYVIATTWLCSNGNINFMICDCNSKKQDIRVAIYVRFVAVVEILTC